jgi:hypothetical protein
MLYRATQAVERGDDNHVAGTTGEVLYEFCETFVVILDPTLTFVSIDANQMIVVCGAVMPYRVNLVLHMLHGGTAPDISDRHAVTGFGNRRSLSLRHDSPSVRETLFICQEYRQKVLRITQNRRNFLILAKVLA